MRPIPPEISLYPKSPAPRYNSYPLLPYWKNNLGTEEWLGSCSQSLKKENSKISIYIHIPFCESLCSFCACNTYITGRHSHSISIEEYYLELIHKEFAFYCQKVPEICQSSLTQLYIGGGTPNFFSPQNLKRLLHPIIDSLPTSREHEFFFEADTRHLKVQHLGSTLRLGFSTATVWRRRF